MSTLISWLSVLSTAIQCDGAKYNTMVIDLDEIEGWLGARNH